MISRLTLVRTVFALILALCGLSAQTVTTPPVKPGDLPPVLPTDPSGGTVTSTAPQLWGLLGGGTVELGQKVTLTVGFYGDGAGQSYVWRKGDNVLPGATSASYLIEAVAAADAGTYTVTVTNTLGASVASTSLSVKPAAAPVIMASPDSLVREVGQEAVFTYQATGSYPRTHQWKKNGADIPGATAATYTIASVVTADAATYAVVVTNAQGSTTSSAASLTVNAATPPTLGSGYPYDVTAHEGGSFSLAIHSVHGSNPFKYQWRKNGVAIPGATTAMLDFPAARLTDAGKYSVVVTNAAGSTTSREAIVTVTPATPVVISSAPRAASVFPGESVSFYVGVDGSSPFTFQWLKNGAPIAGATSNSFSIYDVTTADAGDYSVVVGNILGSVTSAAAKLTIKTPVAPALNNQPDDVAVVEGETVWLSISATGTHPLRYQWYFNGAPVLSGGVSSTLSFTADLEEAGAYHVVVSNAAGSVSSEAAMVSVTPRPPPTLTRLSSQNVSLGDRLSLSAYYFDPGSSEVTFQWYKNGEAIAGATSSSYSVTRTTAADAGDYFVVVTNQAGATTSRTARVTVTQPSTPPAGAWLAAQRAGNIAYFAFTNPARIERFSFATESWLPVIALSRAPTAFTVSTDALFIAYGSSISRSGLDGSNPTVISNAFDADVTGLALWKGFLLAYHGSYSAARLSSIRLSDNTAVSTVNHVYYWGPQTAVATNAAKLFSRTSGVSPSDITTSSIQEDGTLGTASNSPYHGDYPDARRVYVFPDETYVAEDSGTVYRVSDLTFAGALGGRFDDLAFTPAGLPVVLRGSSIVVLNGQFAETGRIPVGITAARVFVHGTNAFAFGYPATGGTISTQRLALSSATAPTVPAAVDATRLNFAPDATFVDKNGTLHLFSKLHRQIFRWSPDERRYLDPVRLQGWPDYVAYSAVHHRIYTGYTDGRILQVKRDAGSLVEEVFATVPQQVIGLITVDEHVFACDPSGAWMSYLTYAPDGRLVAQRDWSYLGAEYVWNPVLRRVYQFRDDSSPNDLLYTEIKTDGSFGAQKDSPFHGEISTRYPIRVSPDGGSVLLGTGKFYDATSLQPNNSIANAIDDAAWIGSTLYTARIVAEGIQLQRWGGPNYGLDRTLMLPGRVVQLHALSGNRLLVVTRTPELAPIVYVLDADLTDLAPASALSLTAQPQSQQVSASGAASFTLAASTDAGPVIYRWQRDGLSIPNAAASTYARTDVQPAHAGVYVGTVTTLAGTVRSTPAILGLATSEKVVGSGDEVGTNIVHPSGRIFDQVLLEGTAASITADAGQVTRISYVDLNHDIVQVEFSGAGTLSLTLTGSSGPSGPVYYVQPGVAYMRGHAGIVIAGANETTNVSVFSVGRANAVDQTLFRADVSYDGVADLAYIAILSSNGKFGGLRCANASFFATKGLTGIYAPGVQFTGPVYVGDIDAFGDAESVLQLGSAQGDTWIAGGTLGQTNARAVQVSGLTQLKFVAGTTSHGTALPAQANQARLERDGVDVTDQLVIDL